MRVSAMTLSPFLWPRFFADDSFYKNRCASRVLLKTKEPTTEKSSVAGSYCPFPRPIARKLLFTYRRYAAAAPQE
nr:MAG TPA: hypothetical protein [Caudoviricetes sp.]